MINTLGIDPTRSIMLRRKFSADMSRRFAWLKRQVVQLFDNNDVLGRKPHDPFTSNAADWQFLNSMERIEAFRLWLQTQLALGILEEHKSSADDWLQAYINEGFKKGMARSFDDVRKPWTKSKGESQFYAGTKDEFLRSAFGQPVSIERVKILTARAYTELEGITDQMSNQLVREFTDGMIAGLSPRQVARNITAKIDKISNNYALSLARTEIVRAHAEGQLNSLEMLGVERVGVSVEWSTAGDHRVCELCRPLNGVVLKIKEAYGLLPRHKNCRCAFIPAGVGEDDSLQIKSRERILKSIRDSLKAEVPKRSKRTIAEQSAQSSWPGGRRQIDKKRTKPIL